MKREPVFMDANSLTIRVNPRGTKTSYIDLQIMEPPIYNDKGEPIRDGKFTQIFLSAEQAKALADILYAESVLDLTGQ